MEQGELLCTVQAVYMCSWFCEVVKIPNINSLVGMYVIEIKT